MVDGSRDIAGCEGGDECGGDALYLQGWRLFRADLRAGVSDSVTCEAGLHSSSSLYRLFFGVLGLIIDRYLGRRQAYHLSIPLTRELVCWWRVTGGSTLSNTLAQLQQSGQTYHHITQDTQYYNNLVQILTQSLGGKITGNPLLHFTKPLVTLRV